MFPSISYLDPPRNISESERTRTNTISSDSFRELLKQKIPSTECEVDASTKIPNFFKIRTPGSDAPLAVSVSRERTPEVFLPNIDVGEGISCCYNIHTLEELFRVKSRPWHFLHQNINYSKLRVLDDFLPQNSPLYKELSSLILNSADSWDSIRNISFVPSNDALCVVFDFCSSEDTLKCALHIGRKLKTIAAFYINDVRSSREMSPEYKKMVGLPMGFEFDLSDQLSRHMPAYVRALDQAIENVNRAWEKFDRLLGELKKFGIDVSYADYSAFGMPVHLTGLRDQRRYFLSIKVIPSARRNRIEITLRTFRSKHSNSNTFDLDQLSEIHDYLQKNISCIISYSERPEKPGRSNYSR